MCFSQNEVLIYPLSSPTSECGESNTVPEVKLKFTITKKETASKSAGHVNVKVPNFYGLITG